MRVLVTGGAGYIGSHVCKALASAGMEPVTFDNLSMGHGWAVRWGPLVEGDLGNPDAIRTAIRNNDVKGVIHLAASAYVGESVSNPRKYFENNTRNTINLLGAMMDECVKHIVFSSTCATYGLPISVPISETHPQKPVNPYGDSKLFIERILGWYDQAYPVTYAALRYFNAAGADMDGEIGEIHDPETHLIPLAIETAMGRRDHLDVYGVDYPTPDGTAIRDYIHVSDLADAHVAALKHLLMGGRSVAVNLGTGRGYSVYEVILAIERVSGISISIKHCPRRVGDPPELVACPDEAKRLLDWYPKVQSLDEMLESAWRWQKWWLANGSSHWGTAGGN